jgi:hypothetical protein
MQLEPGRVWIRKLSPQAAYLQRPRTRLPGAGPGRTTDSSVTSEARCPPLARAEAALLRPAVARALKPRPSPAKNRSHNGLLTSVLSAAASLRAGSVAGDRPWSRRSAAAGSNCKWVNEISTSANHPSPNGGE